jgi:predicted O-methyltransferase YrrM
MRLRHRILNARYRGRYPWLPRWADPKRESDVHPHVSAERAELFHGYDMQTAELEVLHWLHASVMLLKPDAVLETGIGAGLGTIALASACRQNRAGVVHAVEIDPARCEDVGKKLARLGLARYVTIHCEDSRAFLSRNRIVFDLGFFDSVSEIRASEFALCLEAGTLRRLAVFHDTSPVRCESLPGWPSADAHRDYRAALLRLAQDPRCSGYFETPLSRGLLCVFMR